MLQWLLFGLLFCFVYLMGVTMMMALYYYLRYFLICFNFSSGPVGGLHGAFVNVLHTVATNLKA